MDQGVRYVVTLSDINVSSGLRRMESEAVSAERSISSLNNTLMGLAGAIGVGIGAHAFVQFGKDAVQGAADYETAVKRIKFASEDLLDGAKNIAFISSEADKFKIPLQDATDSYGKFLAMVKGSDLAADDVRKLHDELLLIGKVKGLGDGQLDAAVMNLGKMLESGSLDARHFRPLEQQLSGIGKFVADELGITVHQLAILRNKGKMNTIDPKVLLTAIQKQAASLEKFLPESTQTIQSQLNDLDNAWLRFKNDLVFDNITELRSLFDMLKEGVGFLKAHEDTIVATGKALFTVGKAWLEYKAVMGIATIAIQTYEGFMAGYLGEQALVVSATESRTVAMNALALATERTAYATELLAGASLSGAVGLGSLGIPLANAGTVAAAEGTAVRGAAAAAGGASMLAMGLPIIQGALAVYIAGGIFDKYFPTPNTHDNLPRGFEHPGNAIMEEFWQWNQLKEHQGRGEINVGTTDQPDWVTNDWLKKARDANNQIPAQRPGVSDADYQHMLQTMGLQKDDILNGIRGENGTNDTLLKKYGLKPKGKDAAAFDKIVPPNDRVTGQHVVTYNINIKEINGIKENNVQEGGKMNTQDVAVELRDIIVSIVNDSQIGAGN